MVWVALPKIAATCGGCGRPFHAEERIVFIVKTQRGSDPPELYSTRGLCEDCAKIHDRDHKH